MTTTRDVLLKAAEILEPEGAWTQNFYAKRVDGKLVDATDPSAVCWCAEGAIWKAESDFSVLGMVGDEDLGSDPYSTLRAVVGGGLHIAEWNDDPDRTQAEVIAALRAAAESVPA